MKASGKTLYVEKQKTQSNCFAHPDTDKDRQKLTTTLASCLLFGIIVVLHCLKIRGHTTTYN